jgi:hypothetical protein
MGKGSSEMNLDALVKQGHAPWAPTSGARRVDIWHEYDIPTAGTFELANGKVVVFTLIGEPDQRLTVWAYTEIPSDVEPDSFASTDDLEAALDSMFVGHKAVFALADDLKIARWTPLEVGEGVLNSATEFLRGVRASLAEKRDDPGLRFRAELAGVEVETAELVDA